MANSCTPNQSWPTRARGTTIPFTTTFYDVYNLPIQPGGTGPQVVISYPLAAGGIGTATVAMIPPGGTLPGGEINTNTNAWMAEWDSRGAAAGTVYWSIETPGSTPVTVEDGQIILTANAANQPTF